MTVVCPYCLGSYRAESIRAEWCSGACRQAAAAARDLPSYAEILPASIRRDTASAERRQRTGIGLVTACAAYLADHRVRILAGVDPVETATQTEAMLELSQAVLASTQAAVSDAGRRALASQLAPGVAGG